MAEKFISVKDMMDYARSGMPFAITYIKCDQKKGTAGGVKVIDKAVMLTYEKGGGDSETAAENKTTLNHKIKNPSHFNNSTFNLRITAMGNACIEKVHVQLVRRFNGATVK